MGDGGKNEGRKDMTFSIRLPREELRTIEELADRAGISRNALIRLSLRDFEGVVRFIDAREFIEALSLMRTIEFLIAGHIERIEELVRQPQEFMDDAVFASKVERLQVECDQLDEALRGLVETRELANRALWSVKDEVSVLLSKPLGSSLRHR